MKIPYIVVRHGSRFGGRKIINFTPPENNKKGKLENHLIFRGEIYRSFMLGFFHQVIR